MTNRTSVVIIVALVALSLILICCICLALTLGLSAFFIFSDQPTMDLPGLEGFAPTPTLRLFTPRPQATQVAGGDPNAAPLAEATPTLSQSTPQVTPIAVNSGDETLKTLLEADPPYSDLAALAQRLQGVGPFPLTLEPPAQPLQVGVKQTFWTMDTDTDENFQVDATLQYVTEHAYFWVEDGVRFRKGDLKDLAETFENKIYPTNRNFFGSEWTPGVDGDVHLYILFATGMGDSLAGMFSSADSLNPALQEFSNGHEMFFMSAEGGAIGEEYTYGVLAHEFQHMIHWNGDRNEDSWLNEGLSDLAMFLNGYGIGGHDFLYAMEPDIQLNDWPNDPDATTPHYGSSFLYTVYFLNRFGEKAMQAVVFDSENGLDSIDKVLREQGLTDPATGAIVTADDVFADWVVTTFLNDETVGDGRYAYYNYPDAPMTYETESQENCATDVLRREVNQYGVDYIALRCRGEVTLHFGGVSQVGVLPVNPFSGDYAFWSNKGDDSNMSLTQEFDFSAHSGPLTLSYWTWYDIETDYDYIYLTASTDGEHWDILRAPSGTDYDPVGSNYGWGYTGVSGDWIQETVDLSAYTGEKVTLRFDYVTDAAVHAEGFLLDDIAIPEIGYFSDFEDGDGGWTALGFARIQNALPQRYRLSLIRYGDQTTVETVTLDAGNSADIPLDFNSDMYQAVLVVSGVTRYTRQPAKYTLTFR
ncbi:MAG: immune inhibitor A [Chloroflexi bacterium]|nr:immune inhibitor A [Chloroflexota bacterium]